MGARHSLAIVAPLYTIAVLAFLELVMQPRMFDRRPYSSLLIVILLIPLAEAYGLLGLLFARRWPLRFKLCIPASGGLPRPPYPRTWRLR